MTKGRPVFEYYLIVPGKLDIGVKLFKQNNLVSVNKNGWKDKRIPEDFFKKNKDLFPRNIKKRLQYKPEDFTFVTTDIAHCISRCPYFKQINSGPITGASALQKIIYEYMCFTLKREWNPDNPPYISPRIQHVITVSHLLYNYAF